MYPCVACVAEKILFGLPPAVTVVKDNDMILDAVRRNSLLPGAVPGANGSSVMRASLSVPPPLITHTDATPQSSPNDSLSTTQRPLPQLLQCPPFNGDATLSPHSRTHQQVSPHSLSLTLTVYWNEIPIPMGFQLEMGTQTCQNGNGKGRVHVTMGMGMATFSCVPKFPSVDSMRMQTNKMSETPVFHSRANVLAALCALWLTVACVCRQMLRSSHKQCQ